MLMNFLQFLANLLIAMALLKTLQIKLLERNTDSSVGQALAFLVG